MTFKHAISWFEIPAVDISRAQKFYETIFDIEMIPMDMEDTKMRLFPVEDMMTGIGGALCEVPDMLTPSADKGTLIYLNGGDDLDQVLAKVETAGGTIHTPKMQISPEYGFMGLFIDTEGSRIGLHSMA
ncbi:VOC family protein [Mucilaginibacter hurinus]|uniref:VOC family protein n=1 Tax=Mucilaginibacter hurinus TaxID=2201324 RepID=A0A367GVE1_9SPHI|nr:VOC family protein [Mucilaginibacter hurinus]RCH56633.1 VOC family protein [Mucilaginibacter hurinus]